MSQTESELSKKEVLFLGTLGLLAMTFITIAVIPSLRARVKEFFISSNREVLAKVSGQLSSDGPEVTVLKIKNKDVLDVEVFSVDAEKSLTLISRLPLFESRDGFFTLQGNATNLALTDVDKDGTLEIVAPTYDDQMVPRLNIFRYSKDSGTFDRMNAPENYQF